MPFQQEDHRETECRSCWFLALTLFSVDDQRRAQKLDSEQRTARHFDSIRQQPPLLLAFLREMPKGGDLHNHLFGAIYAESLIDFAAQDDFCVDRTTSVLIAPPCDDACDRFASKPRIACAYQDQVLYNSIIDAWSMRNWAGEEPGHDHFFATFDKFQPALFNHIGDAIAETASRAAADHLQYLELMHTADGMQSAGLGAKVGWDDDFAQAPGKASGRRTEGRRQPPPARNWIATKPPCARSCAAIRRIPIPVAPSKSATSIRFCAAFPKNRCSRKSCSASNWRSPTRASSDLTW